MFFHTKSLLTVYILIFTAEGSKSARHSFIHSFKKFSIPSYKLFQWDSKKVKLCISPGLQVIKQL